MLLRRLGSMRSAPPLAAMRVSPMAAVSVAPLRFYSVGTGTYRGPRVPKKWVEVKKAKKRARKLLDRKNRGARPIVLPAEVTPKSLSSEMSIRAVDILKLMIRLGERPWSCDEPINRDVVELICDELYFDPVWDSAVSGADVVPVPRPAPHTPDWDRLAHRTPVVLICGHVDHGKTTLLDTLRGTNVAAGEAGGITQHVSVFQTQLAISKETITFMDTPGHAAFAAIRERGTNMTDMACLIVAADDGVQDQTKEAIDYIKKKNVPYIVVITKIDKAGADPEAVYMQLLQEDVQLQKYGGSVPSVEISAKTKLNFDQFEDAVLMLLESVGPRADNNSAQSEAIIVETEVNRSAGISCTSIVQWGTLRVGDSFVAGTTSGRVRSLLGVGGQQLKEALPGMPVLVSGFRDVPSPGDIIITTPDEKTARKIAEARTAAAVRAGRSKNRLRASLTGDKDLHGRRKRVDDDDDEEDGEGAEEEAEAKELNLILKADVEGSIEAIVGALENLPQDEVELRFIRTGLGEVSQADVELAAEANALVIGFSVPIPARVKRIAEQSKVDLVSGDIIYSIIDHAKARIEDMLDPEIVATVMGEAEVLQCFPLRIDGSIINAAGSRVKSGSIKSSLQLRVVRNGDVLFTGPIKEMKREKTAAKEVTVNHEFGVRLDGWDAFQPGDILQSIETREEKRKLW